MKFNKGKCKALNLRWKVQTQAPVQTGTNELEGSSTEKAFGVLVGNKQTKNQQYTLAEKSVKNILDCIRISVVIRSREVILLLGTGKAMSEELRPALGFPVQEIYGLTRVSLVYLA